MFLGMEVVEIGLGGVRLVVSSSLIDIRMIELEMLVELGLQLTTIRLIHDRNRCLPRLTVWRVTVPLIPLLDLLEYYQVRARGILRMKEQGSVRA
jgi:hypothetical protein